MRGLGREVLVAWLGRAEQRMSQTTGDRIVGTSGHSRLSQRPWTLRWPGIVRQSAEVSTSSDACTFEPP